jgi:hypothetical protein
MKQSLLFEHIFIPQVQTITTMYLEDNQIEHNDMDYEYVDVNGDGGDFYFYPYLPELRVEEELNGVKSEHVSKENVNKYVILKSKSNSIIMLDGSQVIHGVSRFKPNQIPPLFSNDNHHYKIKFNKQDYKWYLYDSKDKILKTYPKNEARIMLVWNSLCFRNENEMNNWQDYRKIKLSEIIETFKKDLRNKGT